MTTLVYQPYYSWEIFLYPVIGKVSDEDYSVGSPAYYRREKYSEWKVTVPDSIAALSNDMGFDLRNRDVSSYSVKDYENYLDRSVLIRL